MFRLGKTLTLVFGAALATLPLPQNAMAGSEVFDLPKPKHHGLKSSRIPGYPDVLGEYVQIPGYRTAGTPKPLDTGAFLRVRSALDGLKPRDADAVIVAMPGFSSIPSHWLYLAAQLVHKAHERKCYDDTHAKYKQAEPHQCRVEVWIVDRRGSNLEDTLGLLQARGKQDPDVGLDYYFGRSVLDLDPEMPGKFPATPAPQFLTGRPDATFRPLEQADVSFMSEWGFEAHAGDVENLIGMIAQRWGAKNVFLAGHSQGGGFVANYAGKRLTDGRRGADTLAGLIFLDGGPSAGTVAAPSATQLQSYFDSLAAWRSGAAPVYTNGTGALPNYNGPGPGARTSISGVYYAVRGPDAESISAARQTGALPNSPAGDAFLKKLRLTNLAATGMGIDTDPIPGRFMQNGTIAFLGEGLGRLDFTPVPGTESLCDPLSPATRCLPHPDQVDPDKVYGWIEGGGNGGVAEVGKAELYAESLAYSPSRTNVQPVTWNFPVSGEHTIFAGYMNPATWYPSNRYDSDMSFIGTFRTLNIQEQGVSLDIDKSVISNPVYVSRQQTAANNPFPLVSDFTEINRTGVTQTPDAAALSPFDPAINAALYRHTDFISADDSLSGQVMPGQPGASAVSNTLIDWVLARAKGRAQLPTPKQLGVRAVR